MEKTNPQPSVNQPKTARGRQTLERIVKAAEKEFGKKGYHATTVNDIAARAKVAPGTIYIYFADKYLLYCHLLQQYGHEIRKNIAESTKGCTSRLEAERLGLLSFLKQLRAKPHLHTIIWESLYINPRLFVSYYETFAARYVARLDAAGDEITPMDTTVLAYMLMGIANFLGLKYVVFDKKADLEYVTDQALRLFRYGLAGREAAESERKSEA